MKIVLEERDARFVTTKEEYLGDIRWLVVKLGERLFYVQRSTNRYSPHREDNKDFLRVIDEMLVKEMEVMLTKALIEATARVPEGPIDLKSGG